MREEVAERYLRHELTDAEQSAYEQHIFECSRCAQELTRLQNLRLALLDNPPMDHTSDASVPAQARRRWPALAALALAASIAGVAVLVGPSPEPARMAREPSGPPGNSTVAEPPSVASESPPSVATQPPAASEPKEQRTESPRADIAETLRRLARIRPPTYRPILLRGNTDEPTILFGEAMKEYVAGNYAAAARGLEKAADLDPTRPDVSFFLGVSRLIAGSTAKGIEELLRTVEMGDTPFLADAHFYLAKGYLAQGKIDPAREQLQLASAIPGEQQALADAMLLELRRLAPD